MLLASPTRSSKNEAVRQWLQSSAEEEEEAAGEASQFDVPHTSSHPSSVPPVSPCPSVDVWACEGRFTQKFTVKIFF